MGRIITFKAPAYHSTSRAASPEMEESCGSESLCAPRYSPPHSPQISALRPSIKTKTVSFSDSPPDVWEVPHWDRSPAIPSPEEVENASDSDSEVDDTVSRGRRGSTGTSVEQATRWARRLSV